jgi:hypothetical protein
VLVCLVAAVVTLSSFGIFKGGGSGRGDEPWETRSEAFPSSDALERSARSFGDRATTDFGSDDRFATDRVGEGDGTDVRDSVSIDEIVQDRPATRPNAPVITNAVVDRTPIATITSEASDSLSEASAAEIKRLKASHEHVGKNTADVSLFPRRAGPAEDVSSVAFEKTKNALSRLGTEEPDGPDPTDQFSADASVRLGSIPEHVLDSSNDGLEETAEKTKSDETNATRETTETSADAKEEEDDDENDSDSDSTTDDSHDALPTEVIRSDTNETPLGEDVEVLPHDAEKDAATSEKEESHEESEASTATVFGEIVDAAAADDVETVETAEAFGVGSEDVLQEAFVLKSADNTASSGDGEEDGEENRASSVDEKKKAFDSDLDPRDSIGPDADLPEEDALRAEDESSRFRSEEGSEEASEQSFADEDEEALVSSETRGTVVSEDEASSAVSAAEKNDEELINSSSSAPPPPPPPRPPPVPMDGPDMTDPVNRAALDAYQSREKYVAWSKKAAKLEGRIVAPTSTV